MAKPSWFESSNNISELSEQPLSADLHPLGSLESLRRVRCLWLISFIQDMRTFMANSPELRRNGLRHYTAINDAILLLAAAMKRHLLESPGENGCTPAEFARLGCLFYISVLIQASARQYPGDNSGRSSPLSLSGTGMPTYGSGDLAVMNTFLEHRNIWAGTVEDLYTGLFDQFRELPDSAHRRDYVLQMTNVLASLSSEARRGVERCL